MNKQEFVNKLKKVHGPIRSMGQGRTYVDIECNERYCKGMRLESNSQFVINTDALYDAYLSEYILIPSVVLSYMSNKRVGSPGAAILHAAGLTDENGRKKIE